MGLGGWLKKTAKKVGKAVDPTYSKSLIRKTTRQLDPSASKSLVGRGMSAVSKVPGGGSVLAATGIGLLNKDVRKAAVRDFSIGATVGAGILGASALSGLKPATPNTAEPALSGGLPGVAGDVLGAALGGGGGGGGGGGSVADFAELDQLDQAEPLQAGAAGSFTPTGLLLMFGGAVLLFALFGRRRS